MNTLLCQFIEEQAAKLTRDDIAALATRIPALRERYSRLNVLDYPGLADQCELLAALIEDCGAKLDCKLPDACRREVAFALLYLEGHGNLLPEEMPCIGYTDDQAIVQIVLHKHRDCLLASPRGYLFRWDDPPADFDEVLVERMHRRLEWMRQDGLPYQAAVGAGG